MTEVDRIKIFYSHIYSSPEDFERDVNRFIAEKKVVSISTSCNHENLIILVHYKEVV